LFFCGEHHVWPWLYSSLSLLQVAVGCCDVAGVFISFFEYSENLIAAGLGMTSSFSWPLSACYKTQNQVEIEGDWGHCTLSLVLESSLKLSFNTVFLKHLQWLNMNYYGCRMLLKHWITP
jgi:hypothetical protein